MADQNVLNALATIDKLIPIVENAEKHFKGARAFSIIDVLGGSFIFDMFKHYKVSKGGETMEQANYLLQILSSQLDSINLPLDFKMEHNGFLTFADYLFDGVFVDVYVASKIMGSLKQIKELKKKLYELKSRLEIL